MEDSIQKQAAEPLEQPRRHCGRLLRRKLEPVSPRPFISRLVVSTPLFSTFDLFSIAPSQHKLELVSPKPFIPTIDPVSVAQISRPLIPIPFSSPIDTIITVSQNSRSSKLLVSTPHIVSSQLFYSTPALLSFPVSSSQTLWLPILSFGDILVVMTALLATDNLFLSSIHNHWRRPRILVSGAQSQTVIELVALVDDFQQRQEA